MKRVSAKEQFAPKAEAEAKPTKKERRARVRGDMRSGRRGVQPPSPEAAESPAEAVAPASEAAESLAEIAAPAGEAAETQAPEAIMIEPTPAGRVWEAVPVEPVESAPAVEPAAPVSEGVVESEARTPTGEAFTGQAVETTAEMAPSTEANGAGDVPSSQAAAQAGAPEARSPRTGERSPRPRNRLPRASTQGEGEETPKPRSPRKPRVERVQEPPSESPPEPPAGSTPPSEDVSTE
jgi:hypothetical protein